MFELVLPFFEEKEVAENLFSASLYGETEKVRLLLAAKVDPNLAVSGLSQVPDGCTAIMPAVHNKHLEIVKLLLEFGVDNRRLSFCGIRENQLDWAMKNAGHQEILAVLQATKKC